MSLLKVKVTPKSKYWSAPIQNYNKLLFLSLLIYYLYYYLYKNTTHDMCHHLFIYDGRDKNTNS